MAAKNARNPSVVWNYSGATPAKNRLMSDGSATWKAGQFLMSKNDALLYECITGGNLGVDEDAINYVAISDLDTATTGVDTNVRVVNTVHADDVYEINELDGTVARTAVSQRYDMDVSANLCTLNVGSGTNAVFEVVQPKWVLEAFQNASTDTLAVTYVKILETALDAEKVAP